MSGGTGGLVSPGLASTSATGALIRRARRGLPRCCEAAWGRIPACARMPPRRTCGRPQRTRSESSIEISTTTVSGWAAAILRAASIPPMPGIRTSSSTSSGRRRSTSAKASSPDFRVSDGLEPGRRGDHIVGGAAEDDLIVHSQHSDFGLAHPALARRMGDSAPSRSRETIPSNGGAPQWGLPV